MKVDVGTAPTTAWARQREFSSRRQMLVMRWFATFAGRRLARLVLYPVVCVVILNRATRQRSARYLSRALGRPATWGDVYRHLLTFIATVLDRVYLLQERFDLFRFEASGVEAILEPFRRGEGVLAFGAHLGSFEALRMIGHEKGLRVAVIMYPDNARLINETLAALAPRAELRTIELGRIDAMLSIRRWLEDGGVAGLLADRSLPVGNPQRSKAIALPFLGSPAHFPDGPFRLAAMLRRPVVFMTGLYHGGRSYELRFLKLADFSQRPASSAEAEARIEEALKRYVELLESLCRDAPYNWFNFFDIWAGDEAP